VEYGQSKVKAAPIKRAETVEAEKQAGEFVHREIVAARDAALATGASTNVLNPLSEARIASEGLSYSLGSPANRWERSGDELYQRLGRLENKFDTALDDYRKSQAPLVGKKIEGTGLFQIGYFTNVALIVGFLFLVYAALKIVFLIYPPVGLGVSGISAVGRVSSSLLKKGFEQVISGSEHFKEALENSGLEEAAKKEVLNLFRLHQMGRQDKDVQDLVKDLTK
jgi:hypothetical protein